MIRLGQGSRRRCVMADKSADRQMMDDRKGKTPICLSVFLIEP